MAQHDFKWNNVKECARIEFYRGVDGDDWENLAWVRLLARLPRYRRGLAARQNPASIENCGNAMEMIGGLSYAAFTHFRHLPLTSEVTFPYAARGVLPSQSREIWGTLWPLFRQLGIRVTHGGASDPAVGGREAAGTATPAGSGPAGGRAGAVLVLQPAADAWDRSPPPRVVQAPTGGAAAGFGLRPPPPPQLPTSWGDPAFFVYNWDYR